MRGDAATRLAVALADPFNPKAKGCSLNIGGSHGTYKCCSTIVKFDGTLNSEGNAIIMVNPSPYNDVTSVWYGDSGLGPQVFDNSYDALTLSNFGLSPYVGYKKNVKGVSAVGLPFGAADAFLANSRTTYLRDEMPNVRARVVCAGLRVTFSGSTLQDGGVGFSLVEPNHDNLFLKSVDDTLGEYSSTKTQRLALRRANELVMFPVNTDMKELSPHFEEVHNGLNTGFTTKAGLCFHTEGSPSRDWVMDGDLGALPNYFSTPVDSLKSTKNASTVLYPLSRRNQDMRRQWYTAGTSNPIQYAYIVKADGTVQWQSGSLIPPIQLSGAMMNEAGGSLTAATVSVGRYIYYHTASGVWYMSGVGGCAYNGYANEAKAVGNLSYVSASPSIIGAMAIKAGSAQAGQTFHVEYIVHCEYNGIGVQGRTNITAPDGENVDLVLASAVYARELSASSETMSMRAAMISGIQNFFGERDSALGARMVSEMTPSFYNM